MSYDDNQDYEIGPQAMDTSETSRGDPPGGGAGGAGPTPPGREVSIRVVKNATGLPISGASVRIESSVNTNTATGLTDTLGYAAFTSNGQTTGKFKVTVTAVGYKTLSADIPKSTASDTWRATFKLDEDVPIAGNNLPPPGGMPP